jgi:hypothetical protein
MGEREGREMKSRRSGAGGLRGMWVCFVVSIVAMAAPAAASAVSPVLEFMPSGKGFPVSFTAAGGVVTAEMANFDTVVECTGSDGEGEITGPRSTVSHYVLTGCETQGGSDGGEMCKSEGANPKEIVSGSIEAELVYIDQAKHEVGVLLDPHGGVYLNFECGGESVEAVGPFLSPVGPIDKEATSFTATLSRLGDMQTPDEYEGVNGEKLQAIPTGKRGNNPFAATAVELGFAIDPSVSLQIKAINTEEIEAKQKEEEVAAVAAGKKRQEEEAAGVAAGKKRQEEEAAGVAAGKKRQEEEAAGAAAGKKRQEEEAAAAAAAKKRQEEQKTKSKPLTRAQMLGKALMQCKGDSSKHKRVQCEKLAKEKYGSRRKDKHGKK